ncbi:MAG: nucleotidyltransferase family protein [Candidatus Melainabacteria bacterium]|nr:nucleotidyltransferase family protein [Candidatus Melainabacteria bacterium]
MTKEKVGMTSAIILAGGRGERLRPLTADRPKAMIEVQGVPLLAYQLQWLALYGINNIMIACGYRYETIQDYFADGSQWQVKLQYSLEKQALGRGGALKQAIKNLNGHDDAIVAVNGDVLSSQPLDDLLRFHRRYACLATIATVPLRSPYGIVDLADDVTVAGFREKPELPYRINAGIYVLDPAIVECLPDMGDHEVTTFPHLAKEGQLRAYHSEHYWRAIDTVKDLSNLANELENLPAEKLPQLLCRKV